jgi:hypothetical protein
MTFRSPFADSLLFHEVHITNNVSCTVVCDFDFVKFADKCSASSPNYVKEISSYDVFCDEIFWVGEVWKSRDLLSNVAKVIAKQHRWKYALNNKQIRCNYFGNPRYLGDEERNLKAGQLGGNYPFQTIMKSNVTDRHHDGKNSNTNQIGIIRSQY